MNIYLRKIMKHDITHQISITKEVHVSFFDDRDSALMKGKKSGYSGNVTFLRATDPRFGGEVKQIINEEGGVKEDDLILFSKSRSSYVVEVISKNDPRYSIFLSIMNENDRHLIINTDEININEINTDKKEIINYLTSVRNSFPRNRIIFGAPGTGKSFTLNNDLKQLLGENNETDYERVTFHPDYSYANFVGTYKPVMVDDVFDNSEELNNRNANMSSVNSSDRAGKKRDISYEYVPGPFMRVLVKALKNAMTDNHRPFVLLIEEINRANVAAVFGDVFQLLDRDSNGVSEYKIATTNDMRRYLSEQLGIEASKVESIKIPNNMFIWATMNSADQGVFPMDTAFKRRWDFSYLGIDDNDELLCGKYVLLSDDKSQKVEWNKLRKAINNFLSREKINEDKQLGPYFLSKDIIIPDQGDEINRERFINAFKNKVIMYLFEDAVKQKRSKMFEGCFQNSNRYSQICKEFEEKGVGIFNQDIILECEVEDV